MLPEKHFISSTCAVYVCIYSSWNTLMFNERCLYQVSVCTLFRHNGPYSSFFVCYCYHDMMLIFRAIDALIQVCHIEFFVTLWNLLNTSLKWLYFSSFSFSFVFFSILTFWVLSTIEDRCIYICHFTVAIVVIYQQLSFLVFAGILYYSIFFNVLYRERENSPMPTCPAFSSVGVPGPLAGRESAPSVALYIYLFIFILLQSK